VAAAAVLASLACGLEPRQHWYACDPDAASPACPAGWVCRADRFCWATAGDGGLDVPPDEASDVEGDGSPEDVEAGDDGEAEGGDGGGCTTDAECDDGNVCNGREVCTDEGACVPTVPPDDGAECLTAREVPGRCFLERCRPLGCGDGAVNSGEDCDDGNLVDGDCCEADCLFTCVVNADCFDGEPCNGDEGCSGHCCLPGEPQPDGMACGASRICLDGSCVAGGCGDGVVEATAGEECDDGNDVAGDGCESDCSFSCEFELDCLDGRLCNGSETCDPAAHRCVAGIPAAEGTPCSEAGSDGLCRGGSCAPPTCGDGIVDADEACDDRNLVDGDGCDNDCRWSCVTALDCLDGSFCNGEEACVAATHRCVAGTPRADGAACDRDGNPETADLCLDGACGRSFCGDGYRDAASGEECDDGNAVAGDGCEPGDCRWSCAADAACDDGEACSGTERCDLGAHVCRAGTPQADGAPCRTAGGSDGACRAGSCVGAACGDGTTGPGEECDDGNLVAGDGCEADCGFSCHSAADCVELPPDACTTDGCVAAAGGQVCEHVPNRVSCDDGDGCTARDVCDGAGRCAGALVDGDEDTYGPGAACGGDCDDGSAAVHPGVPEACNGRDDDCNGVTDDGVGMTCFQGSVRSCTAEGPGGASCAGSETCQVGSCIWSGVCAVSATELCNGRDDDCDGVTDEGFGCVLGSTESCALSCGSGTRTCEAGCAWGTCRSGAEVACNGCDDDGDGVTDEGAWCPVDTGLTTTPNLFAVRGTSAADVWVVGGNGTILRWNGAAWSKVTSGTSQALRAVWAASATQAWAVGIGGTILRWNGTAWSSEVLPGANRDLYAVWGVSAAEVWAGGDIGKLVRRTGGTWAAVPSSITSCLEGFWGAAADDVFVVADGGIAQRWNGSAWSDTPTGVGQNLWGIHGTAADDIWAVGRAGVILHWDGASWTRVPSETTLHISGVWAYARTGAWAAADAGTTLRWNGAVWLAVPSGAVGRLNGVWGASPSEVWVVGDDRVLLRWRE
jgi:cysteine-rich repeat protein